MTLKNLMKQSYLKVFYSLLQDEHVSDEDHGHTKKNSNDFEMKLMGDYHILYLKTDILLLTDVFEEFRNMCTEYRSNLRH